VRQLRPADLEARIAYLRTDEGGRRGPVASGYRPNHDFGLPGEWSGAMHEYPDDSWVQPGQSARALLWLFAPERHLGRLHPGFRFTVREGSRIVGHGEIVRVMHAALERRDPTP
jgi:elongation factor Tu